MAAAATLARRTIFLRFPFRSTISSSSSSSSISSHLPSRSPIPKLRRPLRILRASLVLSSMLPIHSAIASARLVSKLPSEASACIEEHVPYLMSKFCGGFAMSLWRV